MRYRIARALVRLAVKMSGWSVVFAPVVTVHGTCEITGNTMSEQGCIMSDIHIRGA